VRTSSCQVFHCLAINTFVLDLNAAVRGKRCFYLSAIVNGTPAPASISIFCLSFIFSIWNKALLDLMLNYFIIYFFNKSI
jgi:hypothetical protein